MARRSARAEYLQTVMGDCGHVCDAWPSVARFGDRRGAQYICDTCTRAEYGVEEDYPISRWVYGAVVDVDAEGAPVKKVRKKREPKPPKEIGSVRKDGLW